MLVVHHLNDSRSQRILWLLEELGAPYEIKHYQRDATTRLAPPELKAVHPPGKSPVITDGDITIKRVNVSENRTPIARVASPPREDPPSPVNSPSRSSGRTILQTGWNAPSVAR